MANTLDTIFQIGKGGVSENMCKQISDALEARELIKLRVLETSMLSAHEAGEEVAEAAGAELVSVIGSRIILYRESKKNKKIVL